MTNLTLLIRQSKKLFPWNRSIKNVPLDEGKKFLNESYGEMLDAKAKGWYGHKSSLPGEGRRKRSIYAGLPGRIR